MSSSVPGFKQFVRTGITVLVAQTLRIDISLEVGAITETVTVNADAPLLRTESGELAHNVAGSTLNELPILGFSGYIRDPYAVAQLIPGALYESSMEHHTHEWGSREHAGYSDRGPGFNQRIVFNI